VASIKTQFSVGLFVIIGLAIAAMAIIWLGMSHYFEKGQYYVCYFDESVQGLDIDSPVKYRGVSIGRVEGIGVAPDATLIQVIMKIEAGLKDRESMVAQLKSVGITGIMFIELDKTEKKDPDLSPKVSFPSKYPVVKTKPSGIKQFFEGIGQLLAQMKELDTKGISDNFKTALNTISQAIEDAQIKDLALEVQSSLQRIEAVFDSTKWIGVLDSIETAGNSIRDFSNNANQTVASADAIITNLGRDIADIEGDLRVAVSDFKTALENANRFMESGSELMRNTDGRFSLIQRNLTVSLKNLEQASDNLNRFLEIISEDPSLLIFGQQPPARKIESDVGP
jgi:phospholipid/cholesterol/gamma-HCH transport system substrate-binding protein